MNNKNRPKKKQSALEENVGMEAGAIGNYQPNQQTITVLRMENKPFHKNIKRCEIT